MDNDYFEYDLESEGVDMTKDIWKWCKIGAAIIAFLGGLLLLDKPDCSNPLYHYKLDLMNFRIVCTVHAFDQDLVVQQ